MGIVDHNYLVLDYVADFHYLYIPNHKKLLIFCFIYYLSLDHQWTLFLTVLCLYFWFCTYFTYKWKSYFFNFKIHSLNLTYTYKFCKQHHYIMVALTSNFLLFLEMTPKDHKMNQSQTSYKRMKTLHVPKIHVSCL